MRDYGMSRAQEVWDNMTPEDRIGPEDDFEDDDDDESTDLEERLERALHRADESGGP